MADLIDRAAVAEKFEAEIRLAKQYMPTAVPILRAVSAAIAALPAQGVRVPSADDEPEDGEIRQVIVNAKWKPCVSGGGWWVAQDADGQRILLSPDGFLAALEPAEAGGVEQPRVTWQQLARWRDAVSDWEDGGQAAIEELDALLAGEQPAPAPVDALVRAAAQTLLDDLARAIPDNGDWPDAAAGRRWVKASDAAETAPTMAGRPTPIQMIRAAIAAIREGRG